MVTAASSVSVSFAESNLGVHLVGARRYLPRDLSDGLGPENPGHLSSEAEKNRTICFKATHVVQSIFFGVAAVALPISLLALDIFSVKLLLKLEPEFDHNHLVAIAAIAIVGAMPAIATARAVTPSYIKKSVTAWDRAFPISS